LVRDPKKINLNIKDYPNITLHIGNLEFIEAHLDTLKNMDYLMHIATDWSDSDYARLLNVQKTLEMIEALDIKRCKKIVYFSTASILGPEGKAISQAGEYGSGYVKSKYMASQVLPKSKFYPLMVFLYPTLVFGGDKNHPYSHISSGIFPNSHYLNLLKFLYVEGAFHFLHAKDIAWIAVQTLLNPTDSQHYILGQKAIHVKEAIHILCNFFNKKIRFRIKISAGFIFSLAKILRIHIGPWERYCITHPYMVYDTVSPEYFGQSSAFLDLHAVLKDIAQNKV
jgi:nucleoside-diphosphate-sugar epimerase